MITKVYNSDFLKQIFIEVFLNKTDKVTDISNESVLNGLAFGCAKMAQKCLMNQAIVEGHIFPDTAYGTYLDNLARLRGISPRHGAEGSMTYVRVIAQPGTTYLSGTTYTSTEGVVFVQSDNVVVDENAYALIKVKSLSTGLKSNVSPLTITKVNPAPIGHIQCFNDFRAVGGMDDEDDETFRKRIKESVNQLSRTTLSYIEQVFMKINSRVLRVIKGGYDENGKINLYVVAENGVDFTQAEFDDLLSKSYEYLSLNELMRLNNTDYSVKLNNVDWKYVDIDFRVDIDPSYNVDIVRKNIQVKIGSNFDYRYWKYGDKVQWEDLLFAVKTVDGVRYCPDEYFLPREDMNLEINQLPIVRSFIMRNLNGNIIIDNNGVLGDVYFPNTFDYDFANSVIQNI